MFNLACYAWRDRDRVSGVNGIRLVACARRPAWPVLAACVAALAGEGILVITNGGDCPLGPLGDRLGDPVSPSERVQRRAHDRRDAARMREENPPDRAMS
jgi:hypothetical protein